MRSRKELRMNEEHRVRVLIYSDDRVIGIGLESLFSEERFDVVVRDGAVDALLPVADEMKPDVLLMNFSSAITLADVNKLAKSNNVVIMFSLLGGYLALAFQLQKLGARGIVYTSQRLVECVASVASGVTWYEPDIVSSGRMSRFALKPGQRKCILMACRRLVGERRRDFKLTCSGPFLLKLRVESLARLTLHVLQNFTYESKLLMRGDEPELAILIDTIFIETSKG
jgi:hypothetical protein